MIDGIEPSSKAYETSALAVMLYHRWRPYQESSLNPNLRRVRCYPLHHKDIVGTLSRNRTYNSTFVASRDIHFTIRALIVFASPMSDAISARKVDQATFSLTVENGCEIGALGGSRTHKI